MAANGFRANNHNTSWASPAFFSPAAAAAATSKITGLTSQFLHVTTNVRKKKKKSCIIYVAATDRVISK